MQKSDEVGQGTKKCSKEHANKICKKCDNYVKMYAEKKIGKKATFN